MSDIDTLVERLQRANWAYHNGGKEVLSDDEYDRELERLRKLSPAHPFLSVIGAPPSESKNVVLLPYTMGSLDKVRYGEGAIDRWYKRVGVQEVVVTEKLDGLSALFVSDGKSKKLYLRGDGVKGVDVSRVCTKIKFPAMPCVVRGEILLSNEKTPEGSIGRSLVNGWLHRSLDQSNPLPDELVGCDFVGYQVIEPSGLVRKDQMKWMYDRAFKIPRFEVCGKMSEETLKEILVKWKGESKYPLDGIVIGKNSIPAGVGGGEAKNPVDAVAFKASLDDQKEETVVKSVEWNLSRQGLWIPTILIEQVEIGGAKIQRLSGHNAAMIEKNGIGEGARIIVRRSGDVIPTLDTVLDGVEAEMPPEGSWEWDATHTHAKRKEGAIEGNDEAQVKSLLHALQTLEVDGIGPGLVKKMVEGGFTTMEKVWKASGDQLGKSIGAGRGPVLKDSLEKAFAKASQMTLLIASNLLPRGVGERKLRLLYALESDASKWNSNTVGGKNLPAGWSNDTLEGVLEVIPDALEWSKMSFPGANKNTVQEIKVVLNEKVVSKKDKYIVFTNVRDKDLEATLESKGWGVEDSITKKVNVLVVPDGEMKESGKVKKARDLGIEIVQISEMRKRVSN